MLIKYKTEPTIIVLSPNSANLIKILTQFVYSINIRYSSNLLPAVPRSITGHFSLLPCVLYSKISGRWPTDGGVKETEGLKKQRQ